MATTNKKEMNQLRAAAIERLRKSSKEHAEHMASEGTQAGREWAMNYAAASCLKALSRASDEVEGDILDGWEQYSGSPGEALYSIMFHDGRNSGDCYRDSQLFWSDASEHPDDEDWIRGFANGALNFWVEVRDQL